MTQVFINTEWARGSASGTADLRKAEAIATRHNVTYESHRDFFYAPTIA